MKFNSFYVFCFTLFILCSCENKTEAELIGEIPQVVRYSDVKTIFENNCLFCHGATPSNGAPMSLTNYNLVKDAVQNRNLLNRISRQQGDQGAMPLGGPRLPQSSIDLLVKWNADGLLE
jgi:uncharacterized membrane protein